jgi:outer membrane biosynthesis protein TonB
LFGARLDLRTGQKHRTNMRAYLLFLALILSPALAAEPSPAKPAATVKPPAGPPTLEDVIFDPHYLKQGLGPKTLLCVINPPPTLPPEVATAITAAGLKDVTELLPLPAGATPLQRDKTVAPRFPDEKRRWGSPGKTGFLVHVGADGKVLGLYCFQASDRDYAVAAAQALLYWRYKPAKLNGTAVPVLTSQLFEFEPR